MTRILVTGASGLLGLNFALHFYREHDVIGIIHKNHLFGTPFPVMEADLAQPGNAAKVIDQVRPELVLNCAAMANVDDCEREPQLADALNARMPAELAGSCLGAKAKLVHISTDAVFDGHRGNYGESDTPNPQNAYARTKLEGEITVTSACPEAIIARVNFYGWSLRGQRSLAEHFYYNLAADRKIKGFTDVYFGPLYVKGLSMLLMEMADRDLEGIYHVVSPETWSKYDFGVAIANRFGYDPGLIQPISWRDAGLLAPRSPNLTLATDKLKNDLNRSLPDQREGIEDLYQDLFQGHADRIRNLGRKNLNLESIRE